MEWLYAMGGRLTFDVKEADGWDVVFYVKGLARTGKSTIITQGFKKFYDQIGVKTISNRIEPLFGSACTWAGSFRRTRNKSKFHANRV